MRALPAVSPPRARLERGLPTYGERRHDLAAGGSSQLSPYLHFGCVSPLELTAEASSRAGGGDAFVRQLCWRDFYADLLYASPELSREDLHPRGDEWRADDALLAAWRAGRTGYPIVDAGMRQLAQEGWLPNRARLITASFLCKHLYVDWRAGARHYFDLLVDGDVASNVGNWQWVAGTGVDMRPHRVYNPTLQALRHDPNGDYVRRFVPELEHIAGGAVHEPWSLAGTLLETAYPARVVDHRQAVERFRAARRAVSTAASGVAA
jgi:deoxyribodipyrimidine photo-lyase